MRVPSHSWHQRQMVPNVRVRQLRRYVCESPRPQTNRDLDTPSIPPRHSQHPALCLLSLLLLRSLLSSWSWRWMMIWMLSFGATLYGPIRVHFQILACLD